MRERWLGQKELARRACNSIEDEYARRNKWKSGNRPATVAMQKSNGTTRPVGVGKILGLVIYPTK